MARPTRLVTYVDPDEDTSPTRFSVSARLEAVLDSGEQVVLLDDRGWGSSGGWAYQGVEEVAQTARVVVGPDEPPPGRTSEEEAAMHWATLAGALTAAGVATDATTLRGLPHDVVLAEGVLRLLPPEAGHRG
ncbi:hypothetical protein DT076_07435 [Desertihabitans brevis]|uniref:Uncharacterized protein n=1 Tax=Desertihabitans brevis TaxID=2268447 RepID=A0A367YVN7_9ACTN|nr:hypothetical protein [Desertihabitans brevis]RCK69860.1 hypothetical protein DT076_07435 [Desertihabitans brevis]